MKAELSWVVQVNQVNQNNSANKEKIDCLFNGELTVSSLIGKSKKIKKELDKILPGKFLLTLNCKNISRIDSAGLAMLLGCLRWSKKQGCSPVLENLSSQAFSLAEAEGVVSLIKPFLLSE